VELVIMSLYKFRVRYRETSCCRREFGPDIDTQHFHFTLQFPASIRRHLSTETFFYGS